MKLSFLAILSFATAIPALAAESVYSSIKDTDCVIYDSSELHEEPEIDFLTAECPAFGGYRVMISGGDIRYNLGLSYNGTKINTLQPEGFHNTGSNVIEWRFNRVQRLGYFEAKYTALIYRLSVSEYNETANENQDVTKLVVVRLSGEQSCIIGVFTNESNDNNLARKIADNPDAKCIED